MITYRERFYVAYSYWIAKGETPSRSKELAHEQVQFDEEQSILNEEQDRKSWRGPNDSLPMHSY